MQPSTELAADPAAADPHPARGASHNGIRLVPSLTGETTDQRVALRGRARSLDLAPGFDGFRQDDADRSFHSPLEFFETVVSYGVTTDPRAIMPMVNAYLSSNQQAHGIAFFERLLELHGNEMAEKVRAVYLAAYAILRATHANEVPLLRRIGWVRRTFALLEEAKALSGGENPIVNWAAGLIYAQVPFFFFKKRAAYAELEWLAERPESEPVFGFYREVYHHLARLHARDGNAALAEKFLEKSGYDTYEPKAMFMGWFTSTREAGAAMAVSPILREIVPGRVFALFGFGFSDIYFVLSSNGEELIAIDAGTRPDSLEAAHDFLMVRHPHLPPVTSAIITHAHWDHIGGHGFLRELNPDLTIYGRDNYGGVVERVLRNHSYAQFRGAGFDPAWVESYRPDVAVSERREVSIGGTAFELIPVLGGETEDAMLIHVPELDVMFVGDIVMPWYGEPWVNEGFVDDAVATMDEALKRDPGQLLHGHHPLTALYGPEQLGKFRDFYVWLVDAVKDHVRNGYSAKDIVRLNLIPPGLEGHPDVYLSYLAARDNVVARVADQMTGIWREDLTGQEPAGLDNITAVEHGRLLEVYLGLSAGRAARALRKMIDNGDNELALRFAVAAERRFGSSRSITELKEEAGDRLRAAAQFFDPFRFVAYTEMIGKEHKPMPGAGVGPV